MPNPFLAIAAVVCLALLPYSVTAQELQGAITRGDLKQVQRLLDADSTLVNAWDSAHRLPVLQMAVAGGNSRIVAALLDRGADIEIADRGGFTSLHRAIGLGNRAIVQPSQTRS